MRSRLLFHSAVDNINIHQNEQIFEERSAINHAGSNSNIGIVKYKENKEHNLNADQMINQVIGIVLMPVKNNFLFIWFWLGGKAHQLSGFSGRGWLNHSDKSVKLLLMLYSNFQAEDLQTIFLHVIVHEGLY